MKITNTTQRGTKGAMASFFGAGIQEATKLDANGDKFYDAFPGQWAKIFLAFIRSPNGSDIYNIVDTSDAEVRAALDVLIPAKGCLSDVTWPPQFDPVTDIQALTSSVTQRLVYGNEPPGHIPDVWADGATYASEAKTWYDALSSANKEIAWIQTGKPEVIRYALTNPAGIAKHQDCLDEAATKVAAGELPARIATTHKLETGYPEDRYAFYVELLADYRTYFGNDVQLLFHEYKLKSSVADSLEQLQLVMEFWLIMARLKFLYGDTIQGGCFQQLAGVGTTNLFGMDNLAAQGGVWRVSGMYDLWQTIAPPMREQAYIYTNQEGKPNNVQVESFGNEAEQWTFFSNFGDAVDLSVNGQEMTYIDSDLTLKTKPWTSQIPAGSVGVIRAHIVKRQRRSIFYYLRRLFS